MIACPCCHTIQGPETVNTGRAAPCPGCRSLLRIDLFNAFWVSDGQGAGGRAAAARGRAECFYHPGQLALLPCADCGRLLCEVCQVALEGRTICMTCLQAGRDKRKIGALQQRYVRRDEIALHLAFWPALMVFPTLLTAPTALFFALRHWRTPSPVLPKGHWRAVTASVLAGAQVAAWSVLLILHIGG